MVSCSAFSYPNQRPAPSLVAFLSLSVFSSELQAFQYLVSVKGDPPFTRDEGWGIRVAGVSTMGHGPRS